MRKEIIVLLAVFALCVLVGWLFGGVVALYLTAFSAAVVICGLAYLRKERVRS